MPTRNNWRRSVAAWRRAHNVTGRGAAAALAAAAAVGASGCSTFDTPSVRHGRAASTRALSPDQLREIAATFEAQGRLEPAVAVAAAADRRGGLPGRPAQPAERPEPVSPVGAAPMRLAAAPAPPAEPTPAPVAQPPAPAVAPAVAEVSTPFASSDDVAGGAAVEVVAAEIPRPPKFPRPPRSPRSPRPPNSPRRW